MNKTILNIFTVLMMVAGVYSCTPVSDCTNGVQDGTETGIDCGGSCPACPTGGAATCSDGIMNGTETGVDCGGTCTPCSSTSGDYYPFALNNEWRYLTDTLKISNTDNFNGNLYYYFGETPGNSATSTGTIETWNRRDGFNYIQRVKTVASNGAYIVDVTPIEFTILKANLNINDTWVDTLSPTYSYTPIGSNPPFADQTLTFYYEYKILGKDITFSVNGITYNDVYHVEREYTQSGTTYIYEDYYAKDIGLIKSTINGTNYRDIVDYTLF